jgi:hypothetical protein
MLMGNLEHVLGAELLLHVSTLGFDVSELCSS